MECANKPPVHVLVMQAQVLGTGLVRLVTGVRMDTARPDATFRALLAPMDVFAPAERCARTDCVFNAFQDWPTQRMCTAAPIAAHPESLRVKPRAQTSRSTERHANRAALFWAVPLVVGMDSVAPMENATAIPIEAGLSVSLLAS